MAQHAIQSPTDVVDFLVSQHEQIKGLFDQTLSASGKQREQSFVQLRQLLAVHETVEEEIVHPRAKRKIANGGAVVDERLHEEHEAKTVLKQLEKVDVDSDDFTRRLTELRDAVLDHAKHEEYEEFSKLGQELSSGELEKRGPRSQARGSDRAHPAASGRRSQGGNMLAGPFAAMLDRARDAIVGKG